MPLAVTARDGEIMFNESAENVSGSVLADHTNIRNDHITSYPVESVGLSSLLARLGLSKADYLKLDLEGAEYELLDQPDAETLVWTPARRLADARARALRRPRDAYDRAVARALHGRPRPGLEFPSVDLEINHRHP